MRAAYVFILMLPFLAHHSSGQGVPNCDIDAWSNLTDNKKALKSYQKAIAFFKGGDFNEAEEAFKDAIKNDSNFVKAHHSLGELYLYREHFLEAVKRYDEVIKLCPDYSANMYFDIGSMHYSMGNYAECVPYFERFLGMEPAAIPKQLEAREMITQAVFLFEIYKNPVPFDPKPVAGLSTEVDEYLGAISPDNDYFYFIRKYRKKVKGPVDIKWVEEFCVATKTNGEFNRGSGLPLPFNKGFFEGSASLTIDNKIMYFTKCKSKGECDIYYSEYRQGKWKAIVKMGTNINTNAWESQPSISPDGKTLYFASNRDGVYGDMDNADLYRSELQKDGSWSKAINLGPTINTDSTENSPFIHPDNRTLFFSSNGHRGIGEFDIYVSKLNEKHKWSVPRNIGYPINSVYADFGFFVSTDGKKGYYDSNILKGEGGFDIYEFDLPESMRPEKVLFLKGKMIDEKEKPIKNARLELLNLTNDNIVRIRVDSLTGEYVHVQIFDTVSYMLSVQKQGYFYGSTYIDKDDPAFDHPVKVDLKLSKVKKGAAFRIENIHFKTNDAGLNARSKAELINLVNFMKMNKDVTISIEGHTDSIGDDESNQILSGFRAFAVFNFLIAKGISSKRMESVGHGESKPIAEDDTEKGRALNRRTEVVILKQ